MTRKALLTNMTIAGYHNDTKSFVRLLVENRISRDTADGAFYAGERAKQNGVKCNCHICKGM